MSKPNVLTQILSAVQEVQAQLDQLNIDQLSTQLSEVDAKVTDIQSILLGEDVEPEPEPEPQPQPEPEPEPTGRGGRRIKY